MTFIVGTAYCDAGSAFQPSAQISVPIHCSAGAAAAMLAGCGDKTEAPKEAAAPEKTAAAPADKAAGPYKVAFVYVSPASEEGWSRQHDLARIALEKVYGDKVKFTTVENIPAGADSERVLRDLAQQGNKLIFAT